MQRALIVDNSMLQMRVTEEMLKNEYACDLCRNWEQAEAALSKNRPDLILVANVFADLSGYEICEKLRNLPATANATIIMMSSLDSAADINRGFEAGVNDYLVKPFTQEQLQEKITRRKTDLQFGASEESILVVDDSHSIRKMLETELTREGFRVVTAEDGMDGLEKAKQIRPDLITTDVVMPRMDGYAFCRAVRQEQELTDTPIIMITTKDDDESRAKGFEAGVVEYFVKPFSPPSLSKYARGILESMSKKRRRKILIVDDSITTQHVLKYSMNKQGWDTVSVVDGKKLIGLLTEENFDLLFLDLYLRKDFTDGMEILQDIRSRREFDTLPIIVLSASTSKNVVRQCFDLGADDYILKPFDMEEVVYRAKAHLRSRMFQLKMQEQNAKLEKVDRTRMEFFSFITHELRSPLSSILGFTDLLLEESERFTKDQIEYLNTLKLAGSQLVDLISELLDVNKIEAGKLKLELDPTPPDALVHDAVQIMAGLASKKGLKLIGETSNDLPLVQADSFRVRQVLVNLISNAIKFTEKGSVTVSAVKDGANVKFSVKDTGCGIDAKSTGKIFEAYEQLGSERKTIIRGTGLGLHLSRKLCELHNGRIWVESTPGKGSDFQFTIPIGSASAEEFYV